MAPWPHLWVEVPEEVRERALGRASQGAVGLPSHLPGHNERRQVEVTSGIIL